MKKFSNTKMLLSDVLITYYFMENRKSWVISER